MGKHKGQELSYQIQLFQQMRQINEEIVSHLQTSEKNRKKKGKYVTFTPGAKPGPHQLEQQNVKASRVLTHTKWHSAGNWVHSTDHSSQAGLSQTHFWIFAVDGLLCTAFMSTGNTDYF